MGHGGCVVERWTVMARRHCMGHGGCVVERWTVRQGDTAWDMVAVW